MFRRADGFAFVKPDKGAIALAAPWNALPRKPRIADTTQQIYVDAVREFLRTKEIDQPKVKIANILRVDLDGDGEEEVLISATNYFDKENRVPMRSPAGSYSMVLLRRVVAGKVETQLVDGEFYPKAYVSNDASFNAPNAYTVIAVLDLDGDGKMEVVVASSYYEGEATTIYRCGAKRLRQCFPSRVECEATAVTMKEQVIADHSITLLASASRFRNSEERSSVS